MSGRKSVDTNSGIGDSSRMQTTTTSLTHGQFNLLRNKVNAVQQAIDALNHEVIGLVGKVDDDTTKMFLAKVLERTTDQPIVLMPYWWTMQPEWTGGDSMDPRNTKWNQPHIVEALMR